MLNDYFFFRCGLQILNMKVLPKYKYYEVISKDFDTVPNHIFHLQNHQYI